MQAQTFCHEDKWYKAPLQTNSSIHFKRIMPKTATDHARTCINHFTMLGSSPPLSPTISLEAYLVKFVMDFVEDEGLVVIGSVSANDAVSCKVNDLIKIGR